MEFFSIYTDVLPPAIAATTSTGKDRRAEAASGFKDSAAAFCLLPTRINGAANPAASLRKFRRPCEGSIDDFKLIVTLGARAQV